MSDIKKKLPPGMADSDPKKSVWQNVTDYFKSKPSVTPTTRVQNDSGALANVSKSFKSVK
jgi:hypothetical protein